QVHLACNAVLNVLLMQDGTPHLRYFEIVKHSFPRRLALSLAVTLFSLPSFASKIVIPMDAETQVAHLNAYGVAYAALKLNISAGWLLNSRGGAVGIEHVDAVERLCKLRGVSYEVVSDAQYNGILQEIANPDFNGDVIKLEKAPRVAIYTPPNK